MSARTETIRRARKSHDCTDCGRVIMPGNQYVYATSAPWDDIWLTEKWDHLKLCRNCAYLLRGAT